MQLLKVPGLPKAAESRWGTVLFADLRGNCEPRGAADSGPGSAAVGEVFALLSSGTKVHSGQIYHVAGDGMMRGLDSTLARTTVLYESHAASRAMLEQFKPVATRWQRELAIDSGMGVGLHYSEVALGMFGPPGNRATTLVGDTVNVAARLCARARVGEVLYSASVATKLGATGHKSDVPPRPAGSTPFLLLPKFALRGRGAPVDIWCVPAPQLGAQLTGFRLH